jgi:hypothetical protein
MDVGTMVCVVSADDLRRIRSCRFSTYYLAEAYISIANGR